MKKIVLLVTVLGFGLTAYSQEKEVFTIVETMPIFNSDCLNEESKAEINECDSKSLREYLTSVNYPPVAVELELEGRVYLKFIVDKLGKVIDVQIARSSGHTILDEAAIKHVEEMGVWVPGKHNGENVNVQYVTPVDFKLGQI